MGPHAQLIPLLHQSVPLPGAPPSAPLLAPSSRSPLLPASSLRASLLSTSLGPGGAALMRAGTCVP